MSDNIENISYSDAELENIVLQENKEAMTLLAKGEFDNALKKLKYCEHILVYQSQLIKSLTLNRLLGITLNNIGIYNKKTKKPKVALKYLKQALQIELYCLNDPVAVATTHLNISANLSCLENHAAALTHAKIANELLKDACSNNNQKEEENLEAQTSKTRTHNYIISFINMGIEYEYLSQFEKSVEAFESGLESAKNVLEHGDRLISSLLFHLNTAKEKLITNQQKKKLQQEKLINTTQKNFFNFIKMGVTDKQVGLTNKNMDGDGINLKIEKGRDEIIINPAKKNTKNEAKTSNHAESNTSRLIIKAYSTSTDRSSAFQTKKFNSPQDRSQMTTTYRSDAQKSTRTESETNRNLNKSMDHVKMNKPTLAPLQIKNQKTNAIRINHFRSKSSKKKKPLTMETFLNTPSRKNNIAPYNHKKFANSTDNSSLLNKNPINDSQVAEEANFEKSNLPLVTLGRENQDSADWGHHKEESIISNIEKQNDKTLNLNQDIDDRVIFDKSENIIVSSVGSKSKFLMELSASKINTHNQKSEKGLMMNPSFSKPVTKSDREEISYSKSKEFLQQIEKASRTSEKDLLAKNNTPNTNKQLNLHESELANSAQYDNENFSNGSNSSNKLNQHENSIANQENTNQNNTTLQISSESNHHSQKNSSESLKNLSNTQSKVKAECNGSKTNLNPSSKNYENKDKLNDSYDNVEDFECEDEKNNESSNKEIKNEIGNSNANHAYTKNEVQKDLNAPKKKIQENAPTAKIDKIQNPSNNQNDPENDANFKFSDWNTFFENNNESDDSNENK